MKKSKIFEALIFAGLLGVTSAAFGIGRTVAIDDANPTNYNVNGYEWQPRTLGEGTRTLGFTMKIGTTTFAGAGNTSSFRMFEDGYIVLGSGPIADPVLGSSYSPGNTLGNIQGAGNTPLFVIAPLYMQLDAAITSGTPSASPSRGEISTNSANVAEERITAIPPTPLPTDYSGSIKHNDAWGRATWYGVNSPDPQHIGSKFYGQIDLRDYGTVADGDFDFSIRFETFNDLAAYPVVGKGVGGFSLGGVKYVFDAIDVFALGGSPGGISAGNVFTDFTVRGGVITGFGTDSSGNEISRVFVAVDDPSTGVPSPAILALLAIGGLGFTRLQRKKH
jgi:hypothetical protein